MTTTTLMSNGTSWGTISQWHAAATLVRSTVVTYVSCYVTVFLTNEFMIYEQTASPPYAGACEGMGSIHSAGLVDRWMHQKRVLARKNVRN